MQTVKAVSAITSTLSKIHIFFGRVQSLNAPAPMHLKLSGIRTEVFGLLYLIRTTSAILKLLSESITMFFIDFFVRAKNT